MTLVKTTIIDAVTSKEVKVDLHLELAPTRLTEVEAIWGPLRLEAAQRLYAANPSQVPQHWKWNWDRKKSKLNLLAYRCLGIELRKEMQGLMMVATAGKTTRLAPRGRPLVYIDYIEVAPWNNKSMAGGNRKYQAVGTRLFEAAIRVSIEEEFGGRVGLHALPQAEVTYQRWGMTRVEIDPDYENLPYYEITAQKAKEFLEGGHQT